MGKSKYDYEAIQRYYDEGHSMRECMEHFGISGGGFDRAVAKGLLVRRSQSEAQKLSNRLKPREHSDETKQKLREHMLRRLSEGTYPTLGRSNRVIGQPSYPERFFAGVIEREFVDKQVVKEMPFGSFSLDFAWPHLRKCIEIDGEQHYANQEAIDRDARKDAYIDSQGWQVLRIRWKEMFADTQTFIELAKRFIS